MKSENPLRDSDLVRNTEHQSLQPSDQELIAMPVATVQATKAK